MENYKLATTVYVNPTKGNDANTGSKLAPFKSLTRVLKTINLRLSPTIIHLASGLYSTASGEIFPLVVSKEVILLGNEATKGKGIIISGSGKHQSQIFGWQEVAMVLLDDASLMGITVSNPQTKGSGIWIESSTPQIANCTFRNCGREGIFICGNAKPLIVDSVSTGNRSAGLLMAGNSKGEIRRNVIQKNKLGIVISDFAAPLITKNQLSANHMGIAISRQAKPVLRHNLLEGNSLGGLRVNYRSIPDLGHPQDSAGNVFRNNRHFDVHNNTSFKLISAGNELNPTQVKGVIDFIAVTTQNAQTNSNANFNDINGHWATAFIQALVAKGIISGFPDGSFRPEAPITRAQAAAIIAKTFQLPIIQNVKNFIDIQAGFWAAGAISRAAGMGFISGFPDGTFRPEKNLSKIHAILALTNGLKLTGGNPNILQVYQDRAQIPSYATNAIALATQKRLVVNHPEASRLEPLRDITRAEVAAIVYQALVANNREQPIISPYIVNPDTNTPSFSDLRGHWAENFIRALVSMGLTSGFANGTYRPNKLMNRAQYAASIAAAFQPAVEDRGPQFTDVPKSFWAYKPIQIAASSGFVGGFSDRTFRPHENVGRLQVIVSLVNGLNLSATNEDVLEHYTDIEEVPVYARKAVYIATHKRIMVNYPDPKKIQPYQKATRGEVAAMIYQALVTTGKTTAIDSPYVSDLRV
ncbi:MAG: S-layer homology domain-containing protein [Calothrix sp. MO_167.B42]|nr:S-layer homology domain-containing protein [Calothrix sp. MO_167.B42]